jgi:hypothetical protein
MEVFQLRNAMKISTLQWKLQNIYTYYFFASLVGHARPTSTTRLFSIARAPSTRCNEHPICQTRTRLHG